MSEGSKNEDCDLFNFLEYCAEGKNYKINSFLKNNNLSQQQIDKGIRICLSKFSDKKNYRDSLKELSYIPLSQSYKDKVAAFKLDGDTDAHVLKICKEIISPLKEGKFPLVNYLMYSYNYNCYASESDVVNDLVDYVENKLNKEKN